MTQQDCVAHLPSIKFCNGAFKMLHNFLADNRDELVVRCRIKARRRLDRDATETQLRVGIPLLLNKLTIALRVAQSPEPKDIGHSSEPSRGRVRLPESTVQHRNELLALGLSVEQVVHHYGDLCHSVTDLASERGASFSVYEYHTLDRCLDKAIADAVMAFSYP